MVPLLAALAACPSARVRRDATVAGRAASVTARDTSAVLQAGRRVILDVRAFDQYRLDRYRDPAGIFNSVAISQNFAIDYLLATPAVRTQIAMTPSAISFLSMTLARIVYSPPMGSEGQFIQAEATRLLQAQCSERPAQAGRSEHFVDYTPLGGGPRQNILVC